jgi:hypothetical protein
MLVSGEQFFKDRETLYDAMPALWRQMEVADRKSVVSLVDGFYSNNPAEPWSKDNIVVSDIQQHQLLEFAHLLILILICLLFLLSEITGILST